MPTTFWAEAVNAACYVQNRVSVIKPHNKTPYELFLGRKHALSFIRPFGCPVTILNTIDHLGKFNGKAYEGFFIGYSTNSKAFRVLNSKTKIVEESPHVKFYDNTSNIARSGPNWPFDIYALTKSMNYKPVDVGDQSNGSVGTKACDNVVDVGDQSNGSLGTKACDNVGKNRVETEEEKKDTEDPGNEDSKAPITENPRVNQEKDNVNNTNIVNAVSSTVNVASNEVNTVGRKSSIELLDDPNITELEDISIFEDSNKDVFGVEADLNNLESTFQISIDYDEVFALVAKIGSIRLFLAYASFKDFVVYQMDVKSAFLYGKIKKEVYVCQPPGFEDLDFPEKVYKVEKALYGLHQTPRAWYETLSTYLLDNGFQREMIDKTLFIKRDKSDILLVQVYVDDIIFGSTRKEMCTEFEKMHKKFQMSSMGELTFFLGLPDIMFEVCACARFQVNPKISHNHDVKRIFRYLKGQPKLVLWYPKDSPFDLVTYTDSDYAGTKIHIDNENTICIVKNLVFYSKTKHIEIRHHFIRDSNEKKLIQMIKIHTDNNIADLLTKAFDGHTQEEGIDYDEVFAPVARIEAIRLFLAYASFKDFVVHKMDVNSAFLYVKIKEECKKQNVVANSIIEAEYVAALSCYGQVL
nr:ribonuclease H-like domain-containing protein [Tanacetum cinerariifolium]